MAIITFMSDFGTEDHYVAAVKAKMVSTAPEVSVIDISHDIRAWDIAHGAHVLGAVFRDFPEGTVHLVAVNTGHGSDRPIVLLLEGHYFVGADNGLLSLLSEQAPDKVWNVDVSDKKETTFPAKDTFAAIALQIALGTKLDTLGREATDFTRLLNRKVRATKKMIAGHVVRIDHYGNLITNIPKIDFDILSKGRNYTLLFGRERMHKVQNGYESVEPGDCFAVFNTQGVLEVGINQGNASELLGLYYDSPINISFEG